MDNLTLFGAIGAFLILVAFTMNQLKKWKDDYLIYDVFNLLGGTIMVIYAFLLESWPFLALNVVWAVLSLRDVFVDIRRVKKDRGDFFSKWVK